MSSSGRNPVFTVETRLDLLPYGIRAIGDSSKQTNYFGERIAAGVQSFAKFAQIKRFPSDMHETRSPLLPTSFWQYRNCLSRLFYAQSRGSHFHGFSVLALGDTRECCKHDAR
jgi:hypothetical protein